MTNPPPERAYGWAIEGDPDAEYVAERGNRHLIRPFGCQSVARLAIQTKERMMDKKAANSGLATIWAMVYRSTQTTLSVEQEEELASAIKIVRSNWDENDMFYGRADFVCQCAEMHLSALRALPPRKPTGWNALMEDIQTLQRYLEKDSN